MDYIKNYIKGCAQVIDVGANSGQFAEKALLAGFKGIMHSFEPLNDAYDALAFKASHTKRANLIWETYKLAIGSKEEEAFINISGNSFSSSILSMKDLHKKAAPESIYEGVQRIQIKTLDSLEHIFNKQPTYLKIDTQGFEMEVLKGADNVLKMCKVVQMEMSLQPCYTGEVLVDELIAYMRLKGFMLNAIEPGYTAPWGEVLQVEGWFTKLSS